MTVLQNNNYDNETDCGQMVWLNLKSPSSNNNNAYDEAEEFTDSNDNGLTGLNY